VKHILFVCTGNTCRSPIAERLLADKSRKAGLDLQVQSAGVAATGGSPLSEHARALLEQRGIDGKGRSQAVNQPLVDWADVILTMTMNHKNILIQRYSHAVDKIYTLKEYALHDPETEQLRQETEKLAGELQMKMALGQSIDDEERLRWVELERALPGDDVADPFGGSMSEYEATALEIEALLERAIPRLVQVDKL
jgi:protein-tyrosine-phosphatase